MDIIYKNLVLQKGIKETETNKICIKQIISKINNINNIKIIN